MANRITTFLEDPRGGQELTKVMVRLLAVVFVAVAILLPVYGYIAGRDLWWTTVPLAVLMIWHAAKRVWKRLHREERG